MVDDDEMMNTDIPTAEQMLEMVKNNIDFAKMVAGSPIPEFLGIPFWYSEAKRIAKENE